MKTTTSTCPRCNVPDNINFQHTCVENSFEIGKAPTVSEMEHIRMLAIEGTWRIIKGRLLEMANDFENAQIGSDKILWNLAMKQAEGKIKALIVELDKMSSFHIGNE